MKRKTKRLLLGVIIIPLGIGIIVWVMFFRLPSTYSAEPIVGQVVDKDSGKPLAGAIVIAVWELERGFGLEGDIISGYMHVAEVLTDKYGYYRIDGWGPKPRPKRKQMTHNSPRLLVFKEGYDYFSAGNFKWSRADDKKYKRRSVHTSKWNKQTIELKLFNGDLREYQDRIWRAQIGLESVLDPIFGAKVCDWKKVLNFVLIMDKYNKKLKEANIPNALIPGLRAFNQDELCGKIELKS